MPREGKFFDYFKEIADQSVLAAHEFHRMLSDLPNLENYCRAIKEYEHKGDEITHQTVELLHKTFITPLDRDDIHKLISRMDDILDFIEAAADRILLYGITKVPPETLKLSAICSESAEHVRDAVQGLSNMKKMNDTLKICVEINRLENDADQVLRGAMAKLFREEPDTRQLIKIKEVYEILETVTDRCEDVANIIDGILLEHA